MNNSSPNVTPRLSRVEATCGPGWAASWGRSLAHALARVSWLAVLAALAMLALLMLFRQVVSGAVEQGLLRQEATARHSAATWRCTALRSLRQRDACLAELNAPPPTVTLLRAEPQ